MALLLPQVHTHAQPPEQAPPVFRGGINAVRVDVIATDPSGRPVDTLTKDDFEIVEQGQRQTIDTFMFLALDGGLLASVNAPVRQIRTEADESLEAARDDVRLFGIFLDDYHVKQETSLAAREQVARFIETRLGPTDMVGLMHPLDPLASVRMGRNHAVIAQGVRQFLGRKYDYTPRNPLEQQYANYPAETVEQVRTQVSLSALKGFILHLGGLKEGRKSLVLVSEGYAGMLPPQMRDPVATLPGLGNSSAGDPFAGGGLLEDRKAFMAQTDIDAQLREVYDLANKQNVAIYAIDPRGLATGEFGIDRNIAGQTDRQFLSMTMETLRTLALNTDGRAIVNQNDLVAGLTQVVRDSSAYYLLGYSSTLSPTDGKFHEIKVRVKRPGVQIRARRGYWAFTAADAKVAQAVPQAPQPPSPVARALEPATARAPGRVADTWVGMMPGDAGRTRLTVAWEPVAGADGGGRRPDGDARRGTPEAITVVVTDSEGRPLVRQRVTARAVSVTVPTGEIAVKISVEDTDGEVLDTEQRRLQVPAWTIAGAPAFATPAVVRARTLSEWQRAHADPLTPPTPLRVFSRSDRAFVRVARVGAPAEPPLVRLLNRAGMPMALPLTASAGAGQLGLYDIDLPLAAIAAGEYVLELRTGASPDAETALVGFRVGA